MKNQTLMDRIREFIGGIGFSVFLWSIRMTQEQYFQAIADAYIVEEE